jgi:hypothetical protein
MRAWVSLQSNDNLLNSHSSVADLNGQRKRREDHSGPGSQKWRIGKCNFLNSTTSVRKVPQFGKK